MQENIQQAIKGFFLTARAITNAEGSLPLPAAAYLCSLLPDDLAHLLHYPLPSPTKNSTVLLHHACVMGKMLWDDELVDPAVVAAHLDQAVGVPGGAQWRTPQILWDVSASPFMEPETKLSLRTLAHRFELDIASTHKQTGLTASRPTQRL